MKQQKPTHCNNPSCGKELVHTEGRRPKKYCSPKCRISHHIKQNKKPKFVQRKTFDALKRDYEELKSKVVYMKPAEETYDGKELSKLIVDEHPQWDVSKKPKNLDELKALCPYKKGTDEFRVWVAEERQKYNI